MREGYIDSRHIMYREDARHMSWYCRVRPVIGYRFWLIRKTLNRVQFACKYTCRLLLQIGLLATQTQEVSHPFIK